MATAKGRDQLEYKRSDASSATSAPYCRDEATVLPVLASRWFILIAALFLLASATFDTTSTKAANKVQLPPCNGCAPQYFEAPMFQTFIGYVGQFIFLPIYYADALVARLKQKARRLDLPSSPSDFKKPHCPVWIWVLPLLLDLISTSCLNYSTMLTQASTVQMLRSFNIPLTFVLSAFGLKNRIYIHQILGILLVFLGLMLVGIYAIMNPDTETNYDNLQWIGIVTALSGTTISGLQWVVEEAIFRRYYASPFEGVGFMGLYGVVISGAVIGVCQAAGFEDVKGAFYMMSLGEPGSTILLTMNIGYIFSLAINTASGITVTKLTSALLRTVVNAGRTVSIWSIELIFGWATFAVLNFIGLIVILIAMAVYNYNYFTDKEDHWAGDHILRKPVACLPNKYEVTHNQIISLNDSSLEQEIGQQLRHRNNSPGQSPDLSESIAEFLAASHKKPLRQNDLELGVTTAA